MKGKTLLLKPPFFTPWSPPLGIATIKSYLERSGFPVVCFDYNTDAKLWSAHHKYFQTLQALKGFEINDGYSKLWYILNAHLLAFMNGADVASCARVVQAVAPCYGLECDREVLDRLVSIVEKFFDRLETVTDRLDLSEVSFVGTSTYTTSLSTSLYLLRKVKQQNPRITTVLGGGVSADDLALGSENLKTLLDEYTFVDHVVLGEGEKLMLKLLQGDFKDKRLITIADLDGDTLEIDDVPTPDFSDVVAENYFHLTIEGSRSCPFQCSFCSETIQWGKFRKKSKELLVDQMTELTRRHGADTFFMGDSLMNPYIDDLSSELLARKTKVYYDGYLRSDKLAADRERAKRWARSGCYGVRLGVESASASVLDAMQKKITPELISEALKSLAGAGIRTTTYWIAGFPGETESDFQKTLDFIESHHRYIYELEAHPFYSYPYGQIDSRLHEYDSLYPQEVTDIIRFRIWDIVDCDPPREERYERLRRISALASKLGLFNIYTMRERYQAEDRWFQLQPLVREIYEGTRKKRESVKAAAELLEAPPGAVPEERGREVTEPHSVLCYSVAVTKRLEKNILLKTVDEVIRQNPVLHKTLMDGRLVSTKIPDSCRTKVLSVFSYEMEEDGFEKYRRRIFEDKAAELRPEAGFSLRLVLICFEAQRNELLVIAHHDVVETRGVIQLTEDIFWAYEQLAFQVEVTLPERPEPISEEGRGILPDPTGVLAKKTAVSGQTGFRKLELGDQLSRLLLERCENGTVTEIVSFVLLQGLRRAGLGVEFNIDVGVDFRSWETLFQTDAESFDRRRVLSGREFLRDEGALKNPTEMKEALKRSPSPLSSKREENHSDILLDLEKMTADPWLGGDAWKPLGFLLIEEAVSSPYKLRITPYRGIDGIEVLFAYEDEETISKVVEQVSESLVQELTAVLENNRTE